MRYASGEASRSGKHQHRPELTHGVDASFRRQSSNGECRVHCSGTLTLRELTARP
jgi:hypothetical protein